MALIKDGKKVQLSTGYTSRDMTYAEWVQQQDAKKAAKLAEQTSGEAWTQTTPSQTRVPEKEKTASAPRIATTSRGQVTFPEKKRTSRGGERYNWGRTASTRKDAPTVQNWELGLTGTERRERKESVHRQLKALENHAAQARADLDTDTLNQISRRQKVLRASVGEQTVGDRASDTFSGSVQSYGAGMTNAAGTGIQALGQDPERNRRQIAAMQKRLSDGGYSDGRRFVRDTEAQRKAIQESIRRLADEAWQWERGQGAAAKLQSAADRMQDDSARSIASAKEGAGALGQLMVDVGVAGTQMGMDALTAALTGGSALIPMAVRSFGGGAQEARRSGADLDRQLLYGAGSAALSVGTEKISNIAKPFKKMFGAGAAETIAGALVRRFGESGAVQMMQKLSQTAAGRIALSAIGEGGEEVVEDVLQPFLKRATFDPNARFDAGEAGNDFLVGAILGALGGVPEAVGRIGPKPAGNQAETGAGAEMQVQAGVDVPSAETGVQGVQSGTVEPVKAGRVTTIKRPYQGQTPVQAPKNAAAVQVDSGSVRTAQNRINGARGLAQTPLGGSGFKTILMKSLEEAFHPVKGVEVEGVSFDGKPYLVDINRKVPGKLISDPNLTAEKIALLDVIQDVVNRGEYVGSGEYTAHGNKSRPVTRYDYFETPVSIGGRDYIARFDVEVLPDVNNYRTHQIIDMDLVTQEGSLVGPEPTAASSDPGPFGDTSATSADITIPQGADSVKSRGTAPGTGTAAVNENGLTAFSQQERENLSSGKRNKVVSTFNEAVSFVKNAIQNKQSTDRAYLGKVPDATAQMVLEQTGVDITGYNAMMLSDSIRHMFNHHGDPIMEEARGQIPLTPEATAKIPDILAHPDKVSLSPQKNVRGLPVLLFEKMIDGQYITAQAVADGTHSIQADTLYIRKKAPQDAVSNTGESASPEHNVRNVLPQEPFGDTSATSADTTIPQGADSVKYRELDPFLRAMNRTNTGASMDVMEQEARRLFGKDTASDDGLGAADAVSLNSDYDRLQARTDQFHPEGENAARPVGVPMEDFEGRPISQTASTVMGAQSIPDDVIPMIEQMVADGKLSYDGVTNAAAEASARTKIQENGFDGALQEYRAAVQAGKTSPELEILGQTLLNNAANARDGKAVAELLSLYQAGGTNLGQAMQARTVMRKLSPEGQLYAIQRSVYNIDGENIQVSPELIQKFLDQSDQAGRDAVMEEIVRDVAGQLPGSWKKIFDSMRYLAMLGNTRTHVRNIVGNAIFQPFTWGKNRLGGLAEAAAQRAGVDVERTKTVTGANPFGALAREARAEFRENADLLSGGSHYNEAGTSDAIRKQYSPYRNVKRFQKAADLLEKSIGRLSKWNGTALEKEDAVFKEFIYGQTLADYLQANGVKNISDASPELLARARTYAAEEALRNTFNDRNQVSDFVARLGNLQNGKTKLERAAGYVAEGMVPFKRTPANVLVRAVEYSPVGAGVELINAIGEGKKGKRTASQVSRTVDRLAASMTGSALAYAGYLLAKAGFITGGDDEDKDQAAFNDLTGHQSYALETKDGNSFTLDWAAPSAIPFFMGVELARSFEDGRLSADDLKGILQNMSEPMLQMSMLQGLNDAFEDASYAQQRGDSAIASMIANAATGYFTQAFPTLGGQIERTAEDRRMSTYTDKNKRLSTDTQYMLGKISQKVPGWDYSQVPYIDAWGREEETGDFTGRLLGNFVSPGYSSTVSVDNVEKELQRVKDATGDSGVFPDRAPKYFDVDKERKDLTAEEYQTYAKKRGQTARELVGRMTESTGYRALDDEGKAEAIKYVYEYANALGKMSVSSYKPGDTSVAAGVMKSLLPPETYILYKINKDRDGDGTTTTRESVETLMELDGISNKQRGQTWSALHNKGKTAESRAQREAQNPFTGVLAKEDYSPEQALDAWEIFNGKGTEEDKYTKEEKKRDLAKRFDLSLQGANDLYTLMKKAAQG